MHSCQSPPFSPVRDVDLNVLCPARDAQLRHLPESRDVFDSPAQECVLLDHPWLSPGEQIRVDRLVKVLQREDLHPLQRKFPLQEHHLQRFTALVDRRNPHQLLTLLLLYIGHDGLLRAGEIISGLLTTDVLWAPDRTALSLRSTRSKTCLMGPDGPAPLPDSLSLPEETFSHTL